MVSGMTYDVPAVEAMVEEPKRDVLTKSVTTLKTVHIETCSLVVFPVKMKFDSKFSWELTFSCYIRRGRYKFLAECVIVHCSK